LDCGEVGKAPGEFVVSVFFIPDEGEPIGADFKPFHFRPDSESLKRGQKFRADFHRAVVDSFGDVFKAFREHLKDDSRDDMPAGNVPVAGEVIEDLKDLPAPPNNFEDFRGHGDRRITGITLAQRRGIQ